MERSRNWLLAALVVTALGGVALVVQTIALPTAAAEEKGPVGDHWQHHDGHWSFWHEGDKRWYYTDGSHWFFNDGKKWVLYPFDHLFGRENFHKGDYVVPGPEVKVETPKHKVMIHL